MKLTIKQALEQGVAAHKNGKLQDAERLYRAILQSQPLHPDANHNLGVLAVSVNKAEAALPFFKTALEANPRQEQFWLSYIDTLIKIEKFFDAEQALTQAKQGGVANEKLRIREKTLQSKLSSDEIALKHKLGNKFQNSANELSPAIELREVGKYSDAIKWLNNFIDKNPNNAEAFSLLSQLLLLNKNDADAEEMLTVASNINPELPSIYRNKARLLLKKSNTIEALEVANAAYSEAPEDLETLIVLAACLGANNRASEALKIIESVLIADVNYAEAYATRSLIKFREQDKAGACKDAKMCIAIKPHMTQMWLILASIYHQEQNYNDAILAIRNAIEYEPENPELLLKLAGLLQQHNEIPEAITVLEQATKFSSENIDLWTNLGTLYQRVKRTADAQSAYHKALAIDPGATAALNNLGSLARDTGDLVSALHYFEEVLKVDPDLPEVHTNLGITFKELGRLTEAEERYHRAINLRPNYAEAHSNLGNTLKAQGRLDEAKERLQRAIELKPNYAEAHNNLGIVFQEMGRLNEAEESYKQAIDLQSNYTGAYENLGNVLSELNRHDEAVSCRQSTFTMRTGIQPIGDKALSPAVNSLFFELTNKCNFHCTFCPSDSQTRELGSMDLDLIKNLYTETSEKNLTSSVNLHLMGEPTLHPKLIEILKFAASKNVKTDLVTNGSTLVAKVVPNILDALYGTIIASHMTPTQDTYQFRGKVRLTWERYIANLRLLVREYLQRLADGVQTKNDIVIRVMVTQDTASNVEVIRDSSEASAILREWNDFVAGVEQELGLTPFDRQDPNHEDLVRGNKFKATSYQLQQGIKLSFWRAFTFANTRVSDEYELQATELDSYCPKPFTDVGVLWNGDVTLCGLDHDGELKVGNVREGSIETVIQSEEAQKLRAAMLGRYPLPPICQKCQERPVKK